MNIFVVGAERVGKSTVAKLLGKYLKLPVGETGEVLTRELAEIMAGAGKESFTQKEFKKHYEHIVSNKDQYRRCLSTLGDLFSLICPEYVGRKCAQRAKIIVGIRRRREAIALLNEDDIWIKVRGPKRGDCTAKAFELSPYLFHHEVNNFRDLNWLTASVRGLADKIAGRVSCLETQRRT